VEINGWQVTNTWYHRTAADTYTPTGDVFTYSWQPTLGSTFTNGSLTLSWIGGGTLQASPDLFTTFTNVTGAGSPCVLTNLAAPQLFYRVQGP